MALTALNSIAFTEPSEPELNQILESYLPAMQELLRASLNRKETLLRGEDIAAAEFQPLIGFLEARRNKLDDENQKLRNGLLQVIQDLKKLAETNPSKTARTM